MLLATRSWAPIVCSSFSARVGYNCQSLLGASPAGQRKYEEAEPLLPAGYNGLIERRMSIAAGDRSVVDDAGQRIVWLYEGWNQPSKAAEWKQRLSAASPRPSFPAREWNSVMKTLFDPAAFEEIVRRLDSLQAGSARQWGKMTVSQMLEHTARVLEMASGKVQRPQLAIGKMIGWAFRKNFLGPEPFRKNAPTGTDYVVRDEPDLEASRARVKSLLAEFHVMGEAGCDGNVHRFFGKMSGHEWGVTQYKHLDHHLRQFGA